LYFNNDVKGGLTHSIVLSLWRRFTEKVQPQLISTTPLSFMTPAPAGVLNSASVLGLGVENTAGLIKRQQQGQLSSGESLLFTCSSFLGPEKGLVPKLC